MNATLARILSLLGLVSLGEGLFIALRVVPHESPLLGVALAALGGALLFFARPPRIERLPRWPLVVGGTVVALGVIAWNVATGATWVPPKVALVAGGILLVAAAPFVSRPRAATVVGWGIPLAGAPLLVWAAQAAFKTDVGGATPLEIFIEYALMVPMAAGATLLGFHPVTTGQYITFDTADGGRMRLLVGTACSGIQAMGLFSGILVTYVLAEKPGWLRGAIWCAIGLAGVYVVNVVRLITLAVVGHHWGSDALQQAHAQAGWIFFVAWTAIFAWLTMGRSPRARKHGTMTSP